MNRIINKSILTEIENDVCRLVQGDIPLVSRPFLEIGKKLGISEDEVINTIKRLLDKGYMRRFSAVIGHRKAGIKANGMGVWVVPEGERERVGRIMASFKEVTHCYERPSFEGWRYNLFTMIHGRTKEECFEVAKRISKATGITDYQLLFSSREFKKESMNYFRPKR